MTNEELVRQSLENLGGRSNVISATNCMTRLRIEVKDDAKINEDAIKKIEGVLGVVHDRAGYIEIVVGPGKCRKCADICRSMGIPAAGETDTKNDWQANKAAVKANQKQSKVKSMLKTFGDIFVPLLPGVIAAGLCSGLATLMTQVMPNYAESSFWSIVYNLLALINAAFLSYLTAWAGYRAAEKFGATPILGGMLGMITGLGNIDTISQILGLYDEVQPLDSILRAGRGGVLAAVIGVWCLSYVEKFIRKYMPESLDIMFTPLLTLIICLVPYILVVMPITGYISTGLCWIVQQVCMSERARASSCASSPATSPPPSSCPWWPWVCTTAWWPCTRCSLRRWATSPSTRPLPWPARARWARPSPSTSRPRRWATPA